MEYSVLTLAFYTADFFSIVLFNFKSNDYWEILMHHILTITLFLGMLIQNHLRVGVLISTIHAASDVLLCLSRALSQTRFGTATSATFATSTILWVYLRNYILNLAFKESVDVILYVNHPEPELVLYTQL